MFFVCSMGDLFHEDVPDEFIDHVFAIMALAKTRVFIVLTKRPGRALMWFARTPSGATREQLVYDVGRNNYFPWIWPGWPLPNVWLGVSVENQEMADKRIPKVLQIPAALRFVSVEPMLGPVNLISADPRKDGARMDFLRGIDTAMQMNLYDRLSWVICGGETGPGARPMHPDWVRSLRDQVKEAGVPFFLKQMHIGGKLIKMPELDGRRWDEFPRF